MACSDAVMLPPVTIFYYHILFYKKFAFFWIEVFTICHFRVHLQHPLEDKRAVVIFV